jgi:nicotinamide phosphoribosyltransferase
LRILEILGDERSFGHTVNSKGFKVLPDQIRIIQGDGIDYQSIAKILEYLKQHGWSAENINFGSGGGLLQKMNRDTQKCAFKCAAIIRSVDGVDQEKEVQKRPITSTGKRSKAGRLSVHRVANLGPAAKAWLASAGDSPEEAELIAETKRACKIENGWVTFQKGMGAKLGEMGTDELVTVYENGELKQEYTLPEIRARADEWTLPIVTASK